MKMEVPGVILWRTRDKYIFVIFLCFFSHPVFPVVLY
jgi:hypothetical protein